MDLDIRRVIKSIPKDHGPEQLAELLTPWGEELGDREVVFRSHPRPLLAREGWQTLDGFWECAFAAAPDAARTWRSASAPDTYDLRIRVPFSPEAILSGVSRQLKPDELLWYRRHFATPAMPSRSSCVLHFDGVDYACAVYVNGSKVAEHKGAYLPFEVDITHLLAEDGQDNTLEVCVFDPSERGTQLRGKQRLERGGMWYTAQSGIWQSVWLEVVPRTHIEELLLEPDCTTGELCVAVRSSGVAMLSVEVLDGQTVVAEGIQSRRVSGRMTLRLMVPEHRLWTSDAPTIYDLRVSYGEDEVRSYFAFRTVGIETDEAGVPRFCLNHEPFFLRALLDQGLWPDGLLTPPSSDAWGADLRLVLRSGFNAIRKHIKVEPERFYELCDRMGVLVLQDMPSGGDLPSDRWSRDLPTLWRRSWHSQRDDTEKGRARLGAADEAYREEWTTTCEDVVTRLSGHPSVVMWVLFNESWGQFDAGKATQLVWDLDPSRPVLSVSGWYDQGTGDVRGVHNYFRGLHMFEDPYAGSGERGARAQMVSEYGGLTWRVEGHSSLEHTYGYADYDSLEAWRTGLREMLAQMDALEAEGLCGYVYTQLSDVEEETNGLITYDRRVEKLEE